MPPAGFNPYDPPNAELPSPPKAANRTVTVTLVQIATVAWGFTLLISLVDATKPHGTKPLTELERMVSGLTILSLTVASTLTMVCLGGLILRAILRRRKRPRHQE